MDNEEEDDDDSWDDEEDDDEGGWGGGGGGGRRWIPLAQPDLKNKMVERNEEAKQEEEEWESDDLEFGLFDSFESSSDSAENVQEEDSVSILVICYYVTIIII